MSFVIKLLVNIASLFIVIHTIGGVSANSVESLIVAALVIGFLNAFLRPILILFTLPINVLSLGAFTFVINAAMLYLASKFVKGFVISDFWSAFKAALVFSFVSFVLSIVFAPRGHVHTAVYTHRSSTPKDNNIIDVEGKVVD